MRFKICPQNGCDMKVKMFDEKMNIAIEHERLFPKSNKTLQAVKITVFKHSNNY